MLLQVFDSFEGFTFPAPVRAPPTTQATPLATELPRSQFTLQQSFAAVQPQQPAVVPQRQPVPAVQTQPAAVPQRQPVPAVQTVQQPAVVPQRQSVPAVQTIPQQQLSIAPFVAFNNQQFQVQGFNQQPAAPVTQAPAANRFNPPAATPAAAAPAVPQPAQQPQFLNNPSFNLLNPSNFQAFDAQFGGSVIANQATAPQPANPSDIFAQPQTSLLQGRDIIVNPFSNQQSVFGQQQNVFRQPSAAQNVPFTAFRSG